MSEEDENANALDKRLSRLYHFSSDGHNHVSQPLSVEELFDGFLTLYDECTHDYLVRDKNIKHFIKKYDKAVAEVESLKLHASDFEVKDVIGRGHFGVVQVVHEKVSDLVFAMKVLRKQDILSQPEISFYEEERDIMATATSPWITHLHYAFQDAINLYLVMDFHPGGDLLSLLSRHDEKFEEDMAVFYMAEIAVAINDLHEMGYVHRDIKPENILLDQAGHIKLADFGSAAKLDRDKLVSSHLPVGTPDYVAPELLTSLNTNSGAKLYGVEVDWWSLGVCAYEMLYGKTPFTDDYGSMVTTYSNIMQFKTKLKFPEDCGVSQSAKELIKGLLTDCDCRFKWKDIKSHGFFRTIEWDNILQKIPPFIPTINSLDDTSNFEDVERVKRPATPNEHKIHRDFTGLDLPFVGFTYIRKLTDEKIKCCCFCGEGKTLTQTVINEHDGDRSFSTAVQTLCSDSPNVEVTLTVKVSELKSLRDQCCHLEETQSDMKSDIRRLSLECKDKDDTIMQIKIEKEAVEKDLEYYVMKTKTLSEQLNVELEEHHLLEKQGQSLWQEIKDMSSEAKTIEDELTLSQTDDLRDIIIQLEAENENLLRELNQKRRNLASCNKTLGETQKQLTLMQLKLDKERRKSREEQKRDIAVMENRDDMWGQQLLEKQEEIKELLKKVQNLEDLVEAYEDQEREHADEIEQLHQKMDSSFRENLDSSQLTASDKTEKSEGGFKTSKIAFHVTLKSGRPSMYHSTRTSAKIKELENLIDKYDQEARTWKQKEEMMKRVIKQMGEDNKRYSQKSEASQKKKESLIQHMKLYQQEVQDQKILIKELQATMQNSLESKTKELQVKTKEIAELTALVSSLQEKKEDLNRSEERNRKAEEHIEQLISERKELDNQILTLEKKITSLTKQLEEKSEEVCSAERRLADVKSEMQQLYQQKTDLQVTVESLQKAAASKDECLKKNCELNAKINELVKLNSDLEKSVNKITDEKNNLERKLKKSETEMEELKKTLTKLESVEKDSKDLKRKVSRLELVEKEKNKLDEKLACVEKEKHTLETKITEVEKAKSALEEKLGQVDKSRQQLEKTMEKENKDQEEKCTALKKEKDELVKKLQKLESEKKDLEKKIKKLENVEKDKRLSEKSLMCIQKEKSDLENEILKFEATNKNLKYRISELEKSVQDELVIKEKLKKEKKSLEKQVEELKNEKRILEEKISKQEKTFDEELKKTLKKLEDAEKEKDDLNQKVTRIEIIEKEKSIVEEKLCKMNSVELEKQDLEKKLISLEKMEKLKNEVEERLVVAEKDKKTLQKEIQNLKKEYEEETAKLTKEKNDLQKNISKLESEKKDLEPKLRKLEGLEKEKRMSDLSLKTVQTEKSDLENKISNLQKDNERLKERIEKDEMVAKEKMICLEKENKSLEKEVKEMENLKTEMKTLQQKVQRLEKEYDQSAKENENLNKKLDNLTSLQRKNSELEKKVTSLETVEKQNQSLQKLVSNLESNNKKDLESLTKKMEHLEKENEDQKKKLRDQESKRSLVDKLQEEKNVLQQRIKELETEVERLKKNNRTSLEEEAYSKKLRDELEEKVKRLEGTTSELEKEMDEKRETIRENSRLKKEKLTLQGKIDSLSDEVSSLKSVLDKLKTNIGKDVASTSEEDVKENEIQKVRNNLKQAKTFVVKNDENVEDLHQEKRYLEAKVNSLHKHMEQLQGSSSQSDQLECVQQEKRKLESQVEQLQMTCEDLRAELNELQSLREINKVLEDKVRQLETKIKQLQEDEHKGSDMNSRDVPAEGVLGALKKELMESNLSLSEARSLLSASKRQEHELREQIRSLQRQVDNKAMETTPRVQGTPATDGELQTLRIQNEAFKNQIENCKAVESELRLLKSQFDMVQRQNKALEEKLCGLQKEKGGEKLEVMTLRDQLKVKEQQCELEMKKSAKYQGICAELEEQMRDLEFLIAEYEKREAEWAKIRQSFEQAMKQREDELEGRCQTVNAMQMAKNATGERLNQVKQQLQSTKASHKAEIEELNHKLWEERNKNKKLKTKMDDILEKINKMEMVLETQTKTITVHVQEKNYLKEEISKILTENQEVRSKNLELKKNLDEAMNKFELIFGEKIDLENFAEAMQGLHFLEKYKFESTIGQQMKLIDYLQALWLENMDKKKKKGSKLFGSGRSKDLTSAVPPQWKDFQASLEAERKKNAKLQEQVDRLREENFQQANELLRLKGPLREKLITENSTKLQAAVVALSHSPACQPSPSRILSNSSYHMDHPRTPKPTKQRMHHNIPHRFVQGLNTRATKCAVCLGSVHFVKQASKCEECHMVCHPRCVPSVPASCGLPTEYIQQYTDMMEKISCSECADVLDSTDLSIKLDGWLKIHVTSSKSVKSSWERRWVVLDNTWLLIYLTDKDANPVDSFELNPTDVDISVHSAILPTELSNTAATDVAHVMRLDQDPITTCWPGRVLYLMAETFVDKQKWVASLEAVVKSAKRGESFQKNRMQMNTALSLKEKKDLNCSLVISKQCVLLGSEDGLFAWNPQQGDKLTQLSGLGSIHHICLASGPGLIIMISGQDRHLLMVEKKLIKLRLSQTTGGETVPVPLKMIDGIAGCTVFDVAIWQDSTYMCVGMIDRVIIMKYNPSLGMFCTRKELMSDEPCSCVCMAENFAIVGTEKFYKISLEHPAMIDFVDRQDSSLAFALFSATNHQSFPLSVVLVSPAGLPLEFLLCFHEFGVFVDDRGHRSRPLDVKWSGLPLAFAYREPFLYITYFNSVQATVIPADKAEVKGRQTVIDVHSPRYMGVAMVPGAVYVTACMRDSVDMLCIRGQEDYSQVTSDKENRLIESFRKADKLQVRFSSSVKTEKRRRLSQTSLNSNTSDSTSATESDL